MNRGTTNGTDGSSWPRIEHGLSLGKSRGFLAALATFEKGDRYILPGRPEGCFAQNVPVPFFVLHAAERSREKKLGCKQAPNRNSAIGARRHAGPNYRWNSGRNGGPLGTSRSEAPDRTLGSFAGSSLISITPFCSS